MTNANLEVPADLESAVSTYLDPISVVARQEQSVTQPTPASAWRSNNVGLMGIVLGTPFVLLMELVPAQNPTKDLIVKVSYFLFWLLKIVLFTSILNCKRHIKEILRRNLIQTRYSCVGVVGGNIILF